MTFPLKALLALDKQFSDACKIEIDRFFKTANYFNLPTVGISEVYLSLHTDLSLLCPYSGFYIIMTNYKFDENPCRFTLRNLKAIYRGHGSKLKKRVESHLFNCKYNKNRASTSYDNCMQVDGFNGINIESKRYAAYTWVVIQHEMPNSSARIREFMEKQFDAAFGSPLCSQK